MDPARLIIDPPAEGAWNMAVDQAILETVNETGLVTLRFYQWTEPTLSLGYFQNHQDRGLHPPSLPCPFVRRRTGGGAILHDRELTYSLCVPSENRWSIENSMLYETIHQIIIDLLKEQGIQATLVRDSVSPSDSSKGCETYAEGPDDSDSKESDRSNVDQNSFMCFQRRSPGDIVLNGHKIVGSAQRRIQNALLQHGSILLEKSRFSPELPGINDLCDFTLDVSKTIEKLTQAAETRLRTDLIAGKLSQREIKTVDRVCSAFFGNQEWNSRR